MSDYDAMDYLDNSVLRIVDKSTTVVSGGRRSVIALLLFYIVAVNFTLLIVLYLEITKAFLLWDILLK